MNGQAQSEFKALQFAVTDTRQQLPAYQARRHVRIKNNSGAAIEIATNPTQSGYTLEAGETITIPVDNSGLIWVETATTADLSVIVV